MAPRSMKTVATANKLDDVMTLDGEQRTNDKGEMKHMFTSISYFPNGKEMISGSTDNSARRWELQTGQEIWDARVNCEQEICAVAVSRDSRWTITGGDRGELKACEVETEMMKTFEGHGRMVTCVDVSVDNKLLASGSRDHTARIWDLNTGELVAGPFQNPDSWVGAVRFSQDSKKLAVKSGAYLEVWDIQEQNLDRRVGNAERGVYPDSPVFWTTNDRSIVAAFESNFSLTPDLGKIYEFDSSTLETVGAPFEGHIFRITSLALSLDCALLASASESDIKLWEFESRQLLASFDVHNLRTLILSPNSRQLVYTTFQQSRIHICDIPTDILSAEAATQVHSGMNPSANREDEDVRRSLAGMRLVRDHLSFESLRLYPRQIIPCSARVNYVSLNLPEYRRVYDTRRRSPSVLQGMAERRQSRDSSDNDSLPDVHWCKAFFCYISCWSRGTLRMPPRWRLERINDPQSGTRSCTVGKADVHS